QAGFLRRRMAVYGRMPKLGSPALIGGAVFAAAVAWPGYAQSPAAIPDFSGLWGRDSLNLESPPSGPGPVLNMMHAPDGTQDMNKLVGDYNKPNLTPQPSALV